MNKNKRNLLKRKTKDKLIDLIDEMNDGLIAIGKDNKRLNLEIKHIRGIVGDENYHTMLELRGDR